MGADSSPLRALYSEHPFSTPTATLPHSPTSSSGMGKFFKENWIWILTPMVLIVGAVLVVAALRQSGDATFTYNLF